MKKKILFFLLSLSFSYSSFCSEQKREKKKTFIKQLSRLKAALILENKKTAPVRIDNYFSSVKKFSGMVIFVPGSLVLEIEKIKELSGLIRAFRKLPHHLPGYDCAGFCAEFFGRDRLSPSIDYSARTLLNDLRKLGLEIPPEEESPGSITCLVKSEEIAAHITKHYTLHFAIYLGNGIYLSKMGIGNSVATTSLKTLQAVYKTANNRFIFRPS